MDVGQGDLPALKRSLDGSIARVQSSVDRRQNMVEIGEVAQAAIAQPFEDYYAPRMPSYDGSEFVPESWNATSHSHVATRDAAGRSFYQIFEGPYLLSKTVDGDFGTYTEELPTFAGTGENKNRDLEPAACECVLKTRRVRIFCDHLKNCPFCCLSLV